MTCRRIQSPFIPFPSFSKVMEPLQRPKTVFGYGAPGGNELLVLDQLYYDYIYIYILLHLLFPIYMYLLDLSGEHGRDTSY